jgi:diaminopimelate decarboxylase/aspartate kinase
MSRPFVVLKFGGTSVSTAARWGHIASRVRVLLATHRVVVVHSALSQVTNRLESCLEQAVSDRPLDDFAWIRDAHVALAQQVGLDQPAFHPVLQLLEQLRQLLEGVRLTREVSPRLRARVLSFGELAATWLGVAILRRHGLPATRVDARDLLRVPPRSQDSEWSRFLDADVEPRTDVEAALAVFGDAELVLTQGFIARNAKGETCLLGRGGGDTSGALLAALVAAERLEIWTDVHGLFTADPRQVPEARLIRRIGALEAQELAAMGAKVLHPRSLAPAAAAGIPILVKNTLSPEAEGTWIEPRSGDAPLVMAVARRVGVTLVSITTMAMWGNAGFLGRVFSAFAEAGISVDLIATSQSAVTVTLDGVPGGVQGEPFARALERLGGLGRVDWQAGCAVISIVGRGIRTVLHELGPALAVFAEHRVHLVSQSAADRNLSVVVDEADADLVVGELHARLFPPQGLSEVFGPTWEQICREEGSRTGAPRPPRRPWWHPRRGELLAVAREGSPRYVYDLATVTAQAERLQTGLPSVSRFYYAMKANAHASVLRAVAARGFGIECVSLAEVERVRALLGDAVPVLFTPNFCPRGEYGAALLLGAEVTVDNAAALREACFAGQAVAIRVDPGHGHGHHEKVHTAGASSKFGLPEEELEAALAVAAGQGTRIVGLHAHVGSGILDAEAWGRVGRVLLSMRGLLPDLQWVDLGGGLGVVERPGQEELDLDRVEASLGALQGAMRGLALRLEPGRFLVSEAGVLLTTVTQVRQKGGHRFVGVDTGMNSLIRPALYGAWHGIWNLSRLEEEPLEPAHVVGPICEGGDVLGRDRLLPHCEPGDVLLIENAGAYGAVMSSRYNLREPAAERVI